MPSTTFFNLPAAKRERLLRAARTEFGRTAYDQVPVSRIIQAAGIPRGSFYMYFADKQELFAYLLEDFGRQMEERISRLLDGRRGDLFAAFLDLYDEMARERERGEVLFTDYGVSGIAAMALCRRAAQGLDQGKALAVRLALCPAVWASPQALARRIGAVTRDQVAAAAHKLALDTIYFLKGKEG